MNPQSFSRTLVAASLGATLLLGLTGCQNRDIDVDPGRRETNTAIKRNTHSTDFEVDRGGNG